MTEPQVPPKVKAAKTSEYVVLHNAIVDVPGTATWKEVGHYSGTAEQAIKKAAKQSTGSGGDNYKDGEYVAVPARSFKPVKLTTKTETRVTLS